MIYTVGKCHWGIEKSHTLLHHPSATSEQSRNLSWYELQWQERLAETCPHSGSAWLGLAMRKEDRDNRKRSGPKGKVDSKCGKGLEDWPLGRSGGMIVIILGWLGLFLRVRGEIASARAIRSEVECWFCCWWLIRTCVGSSLSSQISSYSSPPFFSYVFCGKISSSHKKGH